MCLPINPFWDRDKKNYKISSSDRWFTSIRLPKVPSNIVKKMCIRGNLEVAIGKPN